MRGRRGQNPAPRRSKICLTFCRLVHRLDKDTSGAMVIARNKDAAEWLGEAFIQKSRQAKNPGYVRIPGLSLQSS